MDLALGVGGQEAEMAPIPGFRLGFSLGVSIVSPFSQPQNKDCTHKAQIPFI